MAKKDKPSGDVECPSWMVSFADIMSLLLTFFVLLVTFSTFDEHELSEACGSLKGALGAIQSEQDMLVRSKPTRSRRDSQPEERPVAPEDAVQKHERFRESMLAALERLNERGVYDMIKIEYLKECISMRMLNPVLFYPNQARLKQKGKEVLALMAEVLASVRNDIRIIGFSDVQYAKPGAPEAWELATARANTVATFLSGQNKVDPQRIAISGWGAGPPEQTGDSRKKTDNLGAEIVILARPRDQKPSAQQVVVTDDWQ